MESPLHTEEITSAINRGATHYFSECEKRIPAFTQKHFSYPGAWHTNKVAFGLDLLRMPINLLWAPFYVLIQLLGLLFSFLGWRSVASFFRKTPSGFVTLVQHRVRNLIFDELLKNPTKVAQCPLKKHIIAELANSIDAVNGTYDPSHLEASLSPLIEETLEQYSLTRTASADIANTIISTAAGAITLKKFTPGGLGLGVVLAMFFAKQSAASDFIFGETLGHVYYSIFPPEPSLALLGLSTLMVLCSLAVVAAFSGLITDPIQHRLGIHQYRLRKMLRDLEQDFKQQTHSRFRPKDQYLARIMELLDTVKTHLT